MRVHFKVFRSGKMFSTPEDLLRSASDQAAEFASSLPPDALIGVTQAFAQHNMAFVTVWYRRGGDGAVDPAAHETVSNVGEADVEQWLEQPDAES